MLTPPASPSGPSGLKLVADRPGTPWPHFPDTDDFSDVEVSTQFAAKHDILYPDRDVARVAWGETWMDYIEFVRESAPSPSESFGFPSIESSEMYWADDEAA